MRLSCFFSRFLSGFGGCERGAAAVVFGVSLAPLAIVIAAATDYLRVVNFRVGMQAGVDAAAIALARQPSNLTDADLRTRGRAIFDGLSPSVKDYATGSFSAVRSDRSITVEASGVVQTAFGGILGKSSVDIHARAVVASGKRKVELSLALDNTGSMAQSNKLVELKKAVTNLLDTMQTLNDAEPGSVKIALVPFTTQVKVGTSFANAPWVRFNKNGSAPTAAQKSGWLGCVTDRDQPQNVQDTTPIGPYAMQHQVADDPKWNNWPRTINWSNWASSCNSLQQIMPLTVDLKSAGPGSLRAAVNSMQANGNTNVSIGVAWGLKALMNRAPFSGAADAGDENVVKALIVLTDGDNTEDRWSANQSAIDGRTRATCAMAKDAVKNAKPGAASDSYIRVYTIRVIQGNRSLLQDCAANGGGYYEVNQASQLNGVFQSIVDEIQRVRLTS